MKGGMIIFVGLVCLIGFGVFVGARMTFIDEDDGIYNLYNNDIILEKGWNLIHFGVEISEGSEIREEDLKAVYHYNFINGKYVRRYPESEEFNELIAQNSCGDSSCMLEERTDYSSWCSQDCYYGFSEEIMSHLNVISEKNVVLAKGEKGTIDFIKNEDMEVYFEDDYSGEGLDLQHTTSNSGGGTMGICSGHEDDYNLLRTYGEDQSKIYVKVDCSGDKKSITFYEVDDEKVNPDEALTPSFQAKLISQPAWVYSNKKGLLKTRAISVKMELSPLKAGWNFITITPEFTGSLNQMKRDCDITRAYLFDAENQEWGTISNLMDDERFLQEASAQGQGMAIKVSGSCTLGGGPVGGGVNPPGLPSSGSSENCADTDGGVDYNVKGVLTITAEGRTESKAESCVIDKDLSPTGYVWEEVQSCSGEDCYLREGYCGTFEESGDWWNEVTCPTGCSDGTCV